MKINIKKTRDDAIIPTVSLDSAGYDLYSLEGVGIPPHTVVRLSTGIAFKIPSGYAGFIWDRSSLGSKGLKIHGGLIDPSYTGEILVCLCNTTNDMLFVAKGDRVAQIVFQKWEPAEFVSVREFTPTKRNEQGFGSSGR